MGWAAPGPGTLTPPTLLRTAGGSLPRQRSVGSILHSYLPHSVMVTTVWHRRYSHRQPAFFMSEKVIPPIHYGLDAKRHRRSEEIRNAGATHKKDAPTALSYTQSETPFDSASQRSEMTVASQNCHPAPVRNMVENVDQLDVGGFQFPQLRCRQVRLQPRFKHILRRPMPRSG